MLTEPFEPLRRGMNEVNVSFRISSELRSAVGRAAQVRHSSVGAWVRNAVRDALKAQGVSL